MEHLLLRCVPVTRAKSLIVSMSLHKPTTILTSTFLEYSFQCEGSSPEQLLTLLMLSGSVWSACRKFRLARQTPKAEKVTWTIARCFMQIRSSHFGASTKAKRKRKKSDNQLRKIWKFLSKHPIRFDIATDGSALGNPGESGAGFVMREVGTGSGLLTRHRSIYLGEGTNNVASLSRWMKLSRSCKIYLDSWTREPLLRFWLIISWRYVWRPETGPRIVTPKLLPAFCERQNY